MIGYGLTALEARARNLSHARGHFDIVEGKQQASGGDLALGICRLHCDSDNERETCTHAQQCHNSDPLQAHASLLSTWRKW
jgi:hypothetical protein